MTVTTRKEEDRRAGEWSESISNGFPLTELKFLSPEPLTAGLGLPGGRDNRNDPRYIRITDITDSGNLRDDIFSSQPRDLVEDKNVQVNDILLAAAGSVGKSYIHLEPVGEYCYAGYLVRFRPDLQLVDPRYVFHWTHSRHFWDQVLTAGVSTTITNVSASRYSRLQIPFPPLAEQERIADILDRETAEIDSMISDLDSFLVLLADRRRTLITDVVYGKTGPGTGEEFPLAPLEILAEFSSGTLLDVARFSKHSDLKTVVYGSNGVIGSTDQDPNVDTPTILVGRVGASGEVNHAPSSVFATDNALVLEPHQDFDLNWMYYTLTASNLGDLSTSTAQPLITASKVKQVRVPHIGLRLQREIADYLDWETGQIDLLIEDARCTRELLVERREALISDAVTGRLRVAV